MDKERLLGFTPWIELSIRRLYYSNNIILRKIKKYYLHNSQHKIKSISRKKNQGSRDKVIDYLDRLELNRGDTLIVHSSLNHLANIGMNAISVLNYLRERIGEEGTLVLPAFPIYNEKNCREKDIYVYNPKKTASATGLMTNIFLRMPGVVRSRFPWNTLAAQGPLAVSMMENNMETDLAHGKNSAWEYCMNHHAKILFLGVRSSHTTTMVHVAEDILDEAWPIKNWYESKTFYIQEGKKEKKMTIRVRKNDWGRYNASWYRSVCLTKDRILVENKIEGINIGFIADSKQLVDYILKYALMHKSFFRVPKKDYK